MIPYIRYLYGLYLQDKADDQVVSDLTKLGLPSKKIILDLSYERFLEKTDSYSTCFSLCLAVELYDAFDECAKLLELTQHFGANRSFAPRVFKIVSDPLIKKHVECSMISRIEYSVIVEDVKSIYHSDITIEDLVTFASLFFDVNEIADTTNFIKYSGFLPEDERTLKGKCRANGAEYTRWAIGAKVEIDAKAMTKDLIADTYFRYKDAQASGTEQSFDKALRLGQLVVKLVDREVKLDEKKSNKITNLKEEFGEQLSLFETKEDKPLTLADLNEDSKPTQQ